MRWLAVEAASHAIALKSREWLAWMCEPLLLLLSQGLSTRERLSRARAGAAAVLVVYSSTYIPPPRDELRRRSRTSPGLGSAGGRADLGMLPGASRAPLLFCPPRLGTGSGCNGARKATAAARTASGSAGPGTGRGAVAPEPPLLPVRSPSPTSAAASRGRRRRPLPVPLPVLVSLCLSLSLFPSLSLPCSPSLPAPGLGRGTPVPAARQNVVLLHRK